MAEAGEPRIPKWQKHHNNLMRIFEANHTTLPTNLDLVRNHLQRMVAAESEEQRTHEHEALISTLRNLRAPRRLVTQARAGLKDTTAILHEVAEAMKNNQIPPDLEERIQGITSPENFLAEFERTLTRNTAIKERFLRIPQGDKGEEKLRDVGIPAAYLDVVDLKSKDIPLIASTNLNKQEHLPLYDEDGTTIQPASWVESMLESLREGDIPSQEGEDALSEEEETKLKRQLAIE
ncbi:MAG: hypothetical protein GOV15_04275, partial [Candidatus Diapherotrites archaeon]|nr:hypothetical protein [Candidatus Diapherotrites archaeon]